MNFTQTDLKRLLHYNPNSGIFTWRVYRAENAKAGAIAGSSRADGYRTIWVHQRSHLEHRLAWFYVHGEWPECIDHVNGNPGDNRLSNLRRASASQNKANCKTHKHSKTGIKGVQFRNGNWRAKITFDGVTRHLGTFNSSQAAAVAYKNAARERHGEFARAS